MEIDESTTSKNTSTTSPAGQTKSGNKSTQAGDAILPESDVYVRLLLILGLIDVKEVEKVSRRPPVPVHLRRLSLEAQHGTWRHSVSSLSRS